MANGNEHPGFRTLAPGPNQRRYVLGEQRSDASYMVSVVHRIEGPLDPARLRQAATELVRRHDALRTDFCTTTDGLIARVHDAPRFQFHEIDMPDRTFASFRIAALSLLTADVDLSDAASLVRFVIARAGAEDWRVGFAAHHGISDGMSRTRAMAELFSLYNGDNLAPAPSFYALAGTGQPAPAASEYWQAVAKSVAPCHAPADRADGSDGALGVLETLPTGVTTETFRSLTRTLSASPFGVQAALYALGLMRWTGSTSPVVAFQSAGRRAVGAGPTTFGPFSNTLPLSLPIDPAMGFEDLARDATAAVRRAVTHESTPYDTIVAPWGFEPDFALNAFPPAPDPAADGLRIHPREFLDRQTEHALNLMWTTENGALVMHGFFDARRFRRARIEEFLALQAGMLRAAMAHPDVSVGDLIDSLRPAPPRGQPVRRAPPCVISAFLTHADETPDAPALLTGKGQQSYAALAATARTVAGQVHEAGIGPGDRVVILADRQPALIAAMIGVSLAGARFAVLDRAYPDARIAAQIARLQPAGAVVLPGLDGGGLPAGLPSLIAATEPAGTEGRPLPGPPRDGPAYYLFTSGTTGTPGCIGHPLAALSLFVEAARQVYPVAASDRVSVLSGLSHDPLMRDIFLPLACGAAMAMPTEPTRRDPVALRAFLGRTGTTIAHLTPSLGLALAADATDGALAGLKTVVWGGEPLPGRQAAAFARVASNAGQHNLYGTSETPQAVTIASFDPDRAADLRSVPIGRPMPYLQVTSRTSDGRVAGPGEVGTLDVELPFPCERIGNDGPVRYTRHQTGDRVIPTPDGALTFLGRSDDQVTINGYRIELAEVEAALCNALNTRQAAVLVDDTTAARPRLQAFHAVADAPSAGDIRARLRQVLPDYMVPAHIFALDEMPLLPNGKRDRAALRTAGRAQTRDAAPVIDPEGISSAAEQEVTAVFERIVPDVPVLRGSSLTALGADSLSLIHARILLEKRGFDLPVGWEDLAAQDLAKLGRGHHRLAWLRPVWMEPFIPVRAAAIFLIVALHLGWFGIGGGATSVLFMVAGLTFAKFMLGPVLASGSAGRIMALILKILITSYPVFILIYFGMRTLDMPAHPSIIGMFANLIPYNSAAPGFAEDGRLVWLWYIHCYLQMFAILALLLSLSAIRQQVAANPFRAALVGWATIAVACVSLAVAAGALHTPLLQVTPATTAPLRPLGYLFLGGALGLARTVPERGLVALATVVSLGLEFLLVEKTNIVTPLAVAAVLLLVRAVPVPAIAARVLAEVSSASLYIYLLHVPMAFVIKKLIAEDLPAWSLTLLTIAAATVAWRLWLPALSTPIVRHLEGRATPQRLPGE